MKIKLFTALIFAFSLCATIAHLVGVHTMITANAIDTVAAYSQGYSNFMSAINPGGGIVGYNIDGVG